MNIEAEQEKPKAIIIIQGCLMLGIALVPFYEGFRPPTVPKDILDWVGAVVSLMGTAVVISSVRALRKNFTIEAAVKKNTKLVMDFPFNFSRNPTYLGGLIMCFSWSLLQRSTIAFILTGLLIVVLNRKVKIEEKNLEKIFGDEYREYKDSVRRFF